jgi:hypothetical protein
MKFALATDFGPGISASPPGRPEDLDATQILARRNFLWWYLSTAGTPDPVTGRVSRWSHRLIARIFGVTQPTVTRGIAAIVALQEDLACVRRADAAR